MEDEFYFGVAISSHTDYDDGSQTAQEFLKRGTITMRYTESNGEEETTGTIELEPCEKFHVFNNAHSESKNKIMQKHVDANQFFCPVDDNLEIWG